jgi:hypothetical protein
MKIETLTTNAGIKRALIEEEKGEESYHFPSRLDQLEDHKEDQPELNHTMMMGIAQSGLGVSLPPNTP